MLLVDGLLLIRVVLPPPALIPGRSEEGACELNLSPVLGMRSYGHWADPTTERASFSPTIAKTFSTSPHYPPLPQVLSYQYSNLLSVQRLSDDLPEPAKMARKFFVGGNFKMCVDTLPRVQRPLPLDTPGTGPTL